MDLVNISVPVAGGYALLGYLVVFFGLVLLMCVILIMVKVMARKTNPAVSVPSEPVVSPAAVSLREAPGTAGDLKLYNTDPRDAAMIMAIVADTLGKPLNELRFKSIREVK